MKSFFGLLLLAYISFALSAPVTKFTNKLMQNKNNRGKFLGPFMLKQMELKSPPTYRDTTVSTRQLAFIVKLLLTFNEKDEEQTVKSPKSGQDIPNKRIPKLNRRLYFTIERHDPRYKITHAYLYMYVNVLNFESEKQKEITLKLRASLLNDPFNMTSENQLNIKRSGWYRITITKLFENITRRIKTRMETLEVLVTRCNGCKRGKMRFAKPLLAYKKVNGKVIRRGRYPFILVRQKKTN